MHSLKSWSRIDPELIQSWSQKPQFDIQDTASGVTPEIFQGWSRLVPEAPIWNYDTALAKSINSPSHDLSWPFYDLPWPFMIFHGLLWPSWPSMTPFPSQYHTNPVIDSTWVTHLCPLFPFYAPMTHYAYMPHAPFSNSLLLWLTMPIMLTHPMPLFQILPPYDCLW